MLYIYCREITTGWKLSESNSKGLKMLIEKHFHKYGSKVCSRIFSKVIQIIECYRMVSREDGLWIGRNKICFRGDNCSNDDALNSY